MTNKRTPALTDIASESALGEEDPGAALESLAEGPEPTSAPKEKPSADTPLESPMPRSPTLDREEPPRIAHEEDIAPEDDAPLKRDAPKPKGKDRLKKASPGTRESGAARKRG